jgi:hypothetical protein
MLNIGRRCLVAVTMLNIRRGCLVPVALLNIRRGRHREHPKDTAKGSRGLRSLRVLHTFQLRMRTPKGTPKGSSDLGSHPVAMVLLLRKKRGKKRGMRRTYFRSGPLLDMTTPGQFLFRSRDFVTSGQKASLRRIVRNFRLHMRRTYFRTGHVTNVTSGHMTSGCSSSLLRKYDFVRAHILLSSLQYFSWRPLQPGG